MRKYIYTILIGLLLFSGVAYSRGLLRPGGGGLLSPGVVTRSGTAVQPAITGDTLGTEEKPWTAGYFTTMNASTSEITNLTISGNVSGNLGIGTTSPQQLLHVFSNSAPTTTVEFGYISSTTAKTCFNVNATDGSVASFYFNPIGIVFETNACN